MPVRVSRWLDTNSGTQTRGQLPKPSFSQSGATIVFRGVYRNTNAGIRKKLTLQPYPYEKPGSGQRYSQGWVANSYLAQGWTYSFPSNGA